MKVCSKCGQEKDLSSFAKNGTGLRPDCKQCRNAQMREYAKANREKIRLRDVAYYAANKALVLSRSVKYHQKNKEHRNKYNRAYYASNRVSELLGRKAYYTANKEVVKARVHAYAKAHPEVVKVSLARRRAQEKRALGACTSAQMKARFAFYGGVCAYCGSSRTVTADHVVPISRGGTNFPANIRPACKSCNSSKGSKKLSEWKPELLRAA